MTWDDFRNIAQGLQALLFAFGAFVGGIWVLFRFGLTREHQRAQLEVEKLRADIRRLSGVTGDIAVSHHKTTSGSYFIYVDIVLTNQSAHVRTLRSDDYPFHINRVSRAANGQLSFEEIIRLRIDHASIDRESASRYATTVTLFPSTPKSLSFFYELDEGGNYLFSLTLEMSELRADSPTDQAELDRIKKIYDEHRENPLYISKPPAVFGLHKYHFVKDA